MHSEMATRHVLGSVHQGTDMQRERVGPKLLPADIFVFNLPILNAS
jgi:hypothetical protein